MRPELGKLSTSPQSDLSYQKLENDYTGANPANIPPDFASMFSLFVPKANFLPFFSGS